MPLINCQSTRPGFQRLSLDYLLRDTNFLIPLKHDLAKQVWVLGRIRCSRPFGKGRFFEGESYILSLLALKILLMAYHRSTLGRAIIRLRIRWYQRGKLHPQAKLKF